MIRHVMQTKQTKLKHKQWIFPCFTNNSPQFNNNVVPQQPIDYQPKLIINTHKFTVQDTTKAYQNPPQISFPLDKKFNMQHPGNINQIKIISS